MTNPIQALKKAHQSQAITRDTHTLQEYVIANKDKKTGKSRLPIKAVEIKYVSKFHNENNDGFRARFVLENDETVGSFSNAASNFVKFFSQLMGYSGEEQFLHIDIDGLIQVDVEVMPLDNNKSTYNFEIVEEGSDLKGFSDYLPSAQNVLGLEAPTNVDTNTGEIKE